MPGQPEAGIVLSRADGIVLDEKIGDIESVGVVVTEGREIAILHSHSDEYPFSGKDWHNVLVWGNIRDSFIVDPNGTHRIHRSKSYKKGTIFSPEEIEELRSEYLKEILEEQYEPGKNVDEEAMVEIWHESNRRLARRFGLKYSSEMHEVP